MSLRELLAASGGNSSSSKSCRCTRRAGPESHKGEWGGGNRDAAVEGSRAPTSPAAGFANSRGGVVDGSLSGLPGLAR